ncbi:fibronectin type III domain-containing protein [Candidatus Poriferisodalis sp.]|uniref:fibronectin type III domain-containing protein n=1 Tax=Candidatus Poriferisodalis sp. TaxID=3101277 RepID=UPI003B02C1F6
MKKLAAFVLLAAMWGVPAPAAAQVPAWTNPEQTVRIDRGFYLFWHESQGATGFDIEIRARSGGEWGEWSPVAHSGTDQPAIVTGLTAGTTYQWRIRGTRGTEQGRWSTYDDDTDKAYTRVARAYGIGVPNPPILDSVTESDGTVTVNWRPGEPRDGVTVTGYEVAWRYWVDGVSHESISQRLPASARSYVISEPLLIGTYYEASVNAVADGKLSAESSNQLEFVPTELSQGSPLSFDGAAVSGKTYTVGARVDWARSNAADQGMPRLPEASGGGRTLTYSIEGLPDGLFMGYDRVLRGTPTAATDGPVTVTYTVTDEHGASDSLTFEVTVNPALTFDPADVGAVPISGAYQPLGLFEWGIHDCAVGTPISVVLPPAYGGTGTLTYQLSDNDTVLPLAQVVTGLSFDTATRTLSGTPTTAGRYAITYWAQDRNGANVSSYSSIAFADGVDSTGICEASSQAVVEEQAPDAVGAQLGPSIGQRSIRDQDPASAQQAPADEELQRQPEQPVPQRPGPVASLQLSSTANTVTVTWRAPISGDAPDRYIVHLRPADGGKGDTRRPKAAKQKVIFRNLASGTAYNIWVRAKNEGGKGERVHAAITVE